MHIRTHLPLSGLKDQNFFGTIKLLGHQKEQKPSLMKIHKLLIVNRITENYRMLSYQDISMLQKAETEIIKICQACHFWKEIKAVNAGNRVPRTSSIHQLDPFVNKDGVPRVSERLVKSNLIHEVKHLVLVPKYCNISS